MEKLRAQRVQQLLWPPSGTCRSCAAVAHVRVGCTGCCAAWQGWKAERRVEMLFLALLCSTSSKCRSYLRSSTLVSQMPSGITRPEVM